MLFDKLFKAAPTSRELLSLASTARRLASSSTTSPLHVRPIFAAAPHSPVSLYTKAHVSSSPTSMSAEPGSKMKSEEEWRAVLSKEQFRILREAGTERPGSSEYDKFHPSEGVFACAGCGTPLYKASHKFNSGCGWPAFFDSIPGAITRKEDRSLFSVRTEINCAACGAHQGHVFKGEGFSTPTDERHCVNGVSLKFHEKE